MDDVAARQLEERRHAEQDARERWRRYHAEAEALVLGRNAAIKGVNDAFDAQMQALESRYGVAQPDDLAETLRALHE